MPDPFSNKFRAATELLVSATSGAMVPNSFIAAAGTTVRYASDALNADRFTLTSDTVYNDCHYTDKVIPESASNIHATVTGGGGIVTINLYGSATNIASDVGSWAPSIDWNFTLTINSASSSFALLYTHDCYPAEELFVNDKPVYTFLPTSNDATHIATCLAGSTSQIQGSTSGGLP